jgi:DNA-binding SARP family transcriptional activator
VEVRVLGPVEVLHDGRVLNLARRQHRLLLGILALDVNHVVTTDRLMDLVWAERPPRQARAVIHSRVSEVRAALAGLQTEARDCIRTHGEGYLLDLPAEQVDIHQFHLLLARVRTSGSDEQRRALLRRALSLWRGRMLGGWLPEDSHAVLCRAHEAARLTAAEDLHDVELRLGNHRTVVDEMLGLLAENPGRERLTAQAMLALHRAGRTAEATQIYDFCRRWLVSCDPVNVI